MVSMFIDVCPATAQATRQTTADSSPTPASDDCVLPTLEHWSSVAHKVLLAIEHSLRQHLGSGTICRLTGDNLTCPVVSLSGHLRHFFWGSIGPRRSPSVTCVNCAFETLLLTYLLTYFHAGDVSPNTLFLPREASTCI